MKSEVSVKLQSCGEFVTLDYQPILYKPSPGAAVLTVLRTRMERFLEVFHRLAAFLYSRVEASMFKDDVLSRNNVLAEAL